jgi:SAM-dependent methyltransferase
VKRYSSAYEHNREPLARLLDRIVRAPGTVLEVGAGTGQHAAYFASVMPSITFVPTEKDPALVESIGAWRAEAALPNLRPPRLLDVTEEDWDAPAPTVVLAIELTHAAPWAVTVGLVNGAARCLGPGGELMICGPLRGDAPPTLDEIEKLAASRGLELRDVHDLPRHGALAVFRRSS